MSSVLDARSFLFVPGNQPARFDKAEQSGASAVILDLEDSVPPGDKVAARTNISFWLNANRKTIIRINASDSEWFAEDLKLCSQPGVTAIMLPKAERARDVQYIADLHPCTAVLPLIESARGFAHLGELAGARNVQRLVFGTVDFQLDLGLRGDGDELLYFRSQLVLESRIAGLAAPVDGITLAIDDEQQLRDDTQRSRRLGFGGKLCVHPRQVAPVNQIFQPTAEELAWARRVVNAVAEQPGGVLTLDGRMVDRPVLLQAHAMLRDKI